MTAQIGDILIFAGRRFALASEPLAPWLQRRRNRHLRFGTSSTANRRGYQAVWEVADGMLQLNRIDGQLPDGTDVELALLFPGIQQPVPTTWFSSGLLCPMGKVLRYEHVGYATRHEYELILWFIEGSLVEQRLNRNRLTGGATTSSERFDDALAE